jgi:hypothetical protein
MNMVCLNYRRASAADRLRWVFWPSMVLLAGLHAVGACAQHFAKGPLLVQQIDQFLYGVDPLSVAVVDAGHVSAIGIRLPAGESRSDAAQYLHYVARCDGGLQWALLREAASPLDLTPQGASARARTNAIRSQWSSLRFQPSNMRDASRSLAQFACAASSRPAQAAQIAKDILDNGGPWDMRTVLCDLQPDGAVVTREDVQVRFSDQEKVVAVNKQWFANAQVTDTEISFGNGSARWKIDRSTAEASLVDVATGKALFAGSCAAAPPPAGR